MAVETISRISPDIARTAREHPLVTAHTYLRKHTCDRGAIVRTNVGVSMAEGQFDIAKWADIAVSGMEDWSDQGLWVLIVPKRVGRRRRINFGIEHVFVAPWLLDDPVARDGLEFFIPGGDTSNVVDPRGVACDWLKGDEVLLIDPVAWTQTRVTLAA